MDDGKRLDTNGQPKEQEPGDGGELRRANGSRARNRTVMLSPEITGQWRAMLAQEQSREGAPPLSNAVTDVLPPMDWVRADQMQKPAQDGLSGSTNGSAPSIMTAPMTQSMSQKPTAEYQIPQNSMPGVQGAAARAAGQQMPPVAASNMLNNQRGNATSRIDLSQLGEPLGMRADARGESRTDAASSGYMSPQQMKQMSQAPQGISNQGMQNQGMVKQGMLGQGMPGQNMPGQNMSGQNMLGQGIQRQNPAPMGGSYTGAQQQGMPRNMMNHVDSSPINSLNTTMQSPKPAQGMGSSQLNVIQQGSVGTTLLVGFLVSYDGNQFGEMYEIRAGRWMITSRPTDHGDFLLINDQTVSPLHAILRVTQDGKVQVLDQLSEYGTAVIRAGSGTEEEVAGSMVGIGHGDTIRLGNRHFVLCLVPPAAKKG